MAYRVRNLPIRPVVRRVHFIYMGVYGIENTIALIHEKLGLQVDDVVQISDQRHPMTGFVGEVYLVLDEGIWIRELNFGDDNPREVRYLSPNQLSLIQV